MEKLNLPPDENGYSVQATVAPLEQVLDGGIARQRVDMLDGSYTVAVQWTRPKKQFEYLRNFYRDYLGRNCEPFLIDLYSNSSEFSEYEAIFLSFQPIGSQDGISFGVRATLEVTPVNDESSNWPDFPIHWISLDAEHLPVRVRPAGSSGPWGYSETFKIQELCEAAGGSYLGFNTCSISLEYEGVPLEDKSRNNRTVVRHPSNASQTTLQYGGYTGARAIGNGNSDLDGALSFVGWWVEVAEPLPLASGKWRFNGAIRTIDIASGIYPFAKQNGEIADGSDDERPPLFIWFSTASAVSPLHLVVEGWANTEEHWLIDAIIPRDEWSYIEVERNDDGDTGFVTVKVNGSSVGSAVTVVGSGGGTLPTPVGNLWLGRTIAFGSESLSNGTMDAIDIYTVD